MPARAADTGTVSRTVALLREIAEAEGEVQIKTLAGRLALPPSTVHRLLDLLAQEGMVERDEATRTYRAGREYFRLSSLVLQANPLRAVAMPLLEEAVRECNETAYLGLYLPRERKMMFAAACESPHPLGYRVKQNAPVSVLTGASGRSILAWLPEREIDEALAAETDDPVVRKAVRSRRSLMEDLAQIRARGYAVTYGQRIPGAVGVFSAVFDAQGTVIGCIGYTVPEQRYQPARLPKLAAASRKYAGALSAALGYRQRKTA
jgi:DNA-binding IclR family transcriptional regulator